MTKIEELKTHALHMRKLCLQMAYNCGGSAHLGGGLSLIEALAVLYGAVLNKHLPYEKQDKFILNKRQTSAKMSTSATVISHLKA